MGSSTVDALHAGPQFLSGFDGPYGRDGESSKYSNLGVNALQHDSDLSNDLSKLLRQKARSRGSLPNLSSDLVISNDKNSRHSTLDLDEGIQGGCSHELVEC